MLLRIEVDRRYLLTKSRYFRLYPSKKRRLNFWIQMQKNAYPIGKLNFFKKKPKTLQCFFVTKKLIVLTSEKIWVYCMFQPWGFLFSCFTKMRSNSGLFGSYLVVLREKKFKIGEISKKFDSETKKHQLCWALFQETNAVLGKQQPWNSAVQYWFLASKNLCFSANQNWIMTVQRF